MRFLLQLTAICSFMGTRTRQNISWIPLWLVSIAALAQARITLHSPTAYPLYSSLRYLALLTCLDTPMMPIIDRWFC